MLRYKFSLVALHFAVSGEGKIMDKSIGTHFHFCGVFQFTQVQPLPSPHKQCWTPVSRIFFEFQLCIGWGVGRTARNFRKGCTISRANREMTEKYEYCSTVPRTFVQDCSFATNVRNKLGEKLPWVMSPRNYSKSSSKVDSVFLF